MTQTTHHAEPPTPVSDQLIAEVQKITAQYAEGAINHAECLIAIVAVTWGALDVIEAERTALAAYYDRLVVN
jgi:hypothetical protein